MPPKPSRPTNQAKPRKSRKTRVEEPQFVSPSGDDQFSIPQSQLTEKLFQYGFLAYDSVEAAKRGVTKQELRTSLIAYQRFHGLEVDGWPGPVTQRSMFEDRFCGLPDVMALQERLCRWPVSESKPVLRWHVKDAPVGLDRKVVLDAFAWAWAQVEQACNLKPEYTDDPSKAQVYSDFGEIDRAGGTLAYSELPCSARPVRCSQRYDRQEPWEVSETPRRFMIDLARVCLHEILHALGIPHLAAGNLMQPTYDQRIRTLQEGDITELVRRYGDRKPSQPPPAPTGGRSIVTIEFDGTFVGATLPDGWKVSKVEPA